MLNLAKITLWKCGTLENCHYAECAINMCTLKRRLMYDKKPNKL